jgi:Caspase domain
MRRNVPIIFFSVFIFGAAAFLYASGASVHAQQTNPTNFIQTYEAAVAKARQACATLWSDHIYDALRTKIPLGEEKPTFQMLTNTERLHPKDKPVADAAIKTVEKCRTAYAPVYAMLPSQATTLIQGVQRQQDAVIAELYRGKITFGDFNVAMNRLNGTLAEALSGVSTSSQSATVAPERSAQSSAAQPKLPTPHSQKEQRDSKSVTVSNEIRMALVIGNSNYVNLPKLANPANDARAIADVLQKIGYKTHLVLDASEQNIRREVRKFASVSEKADVAVVFYAGHGAQLNGNNYLLPVDIDIPRTEVDIQFTGLKVDDLVNSISSTQK